MSILKKGTDFGATEQVTSTKLDNLVDAAKFTDTSENAVTYAGSTGTCLNTGGLEVTSNGQLQVKDAGVSPVKTSFLDSSVDITANSTVRILSKQASDGKYTSVTPSGAVTMSQAGAFTLGDDSITSNKLSFIEDSVSTASGKILIADGSNYDAETMSGDATIAAGGAITIADEAVTLAKMAHIATDKILGRTSASTGDVEALSFLDEDTMSSNSDTAIATQQSIKAYVDNRVNIASTTKRTASTITTNSENSYVDIPDMEVAITAKRGSSSYLVNGVLSWNSNSSTTESVIKVQYKIGSGSYQDFLLPTSAGSRQTGHFGLNTPSGNDEQMYACPFSIMLPSSVEDVSLGSVVTFKLQLCSYTRSGSVFINRSKDDTNDNDHPRGVSTITVQEI